MILKVWCITYIVLFLLAYLRFSDWSVFLYVENISHFQLLLQNHCMPSHHIYNNCPSSGPEEVLYILKLLEI